MWEMLLHRLFGVGEPPSGGRFGSGVVGHTSHAMIVVAAASGGISWAMSGNPWFALGIVGILSGVFAIYLVGTWIFSHLHPDLSALGGSEWRRFQELQMGAQGFPVIPPSMPMADPHVLPLPREPDAPPDGE